MVTALFALDLLILKVAAEGTGRGPIGNAASMASQVVAGGGFPFKGQPPGNSGDRHTRTECRQDPIKPRGHLARLPVRSKSAGLKV